MKNTVIVELTPPAQRDLKALWDISEEVTDHIRELKIDPEKGHPLSGSLQGVRALEFSMQGSGQYRAAYLYSASENKVTVFMVGSHENFYDEANRRVKLMKALLKKIREEHRAASKKKPAKEAPAAESGKG